MSNEIFQTIIIVHHLNLLHSKIHGNNVVSGAVKLNRDSIDPLFVSVSPTPLPTETKEDLRIEL